MKTETNNKRRCKTSPQAVYTEYEKGRSYNESIGLYEKIKNAENFFIGKQWEGVAAPNMDKPVFNIMKRVVNYFVAMMVSDNIGVSLSVFNRKEDGVMRTALDVVKRQVELVMEYNKFNKLIRSLLRNAAVDGDACMHIYFDPDIKTGKSGEEGFIICEEIDAVNCFFGNPNIHEVQEQPYIILAKRRILGEVRDELYEDEKNEEAESIKPDSPYDDAYEKEENYNEKVTVLTKYWKENGHIWFCVTGGGVTITPPTDTELSLYPVCWMNWDRVKNCYHGAGVIDGLIPNQIAINKMAAMVVQFIKQQAFPRVIYNRTKLDKWVGGVQPLAVDGDPSDVVFTDRHNTTFSGQVSEYFYSFMNSTKELMGASDASLGNISNPDNTSAIIATQKATAVPLELNRQEYYQFIEDFVRICIDQMRERFSKRTALGKNEAGETEEVYFDFSKLKEWVLTLNVDIGQAAYWNELTGIETLTNLREADLVEPLTYLEAIPNSYIPQKERIIEEYKRREAAMQEQAQTEAQMAAEQPPGGLPSML